MKKVGRKKKKKKKYLIRRIWQDSFSRGFIFSISTGKYEKKAIKFRDLSVLKLILFFKKKFLDKLEQAMCEISAINVISQLNIQNGTFNCQ